MHRNLYVNIVAVISIALAAMLGFSLSPVAVPDTLKDADKALQVTYVALLEGASDPGVVSWYGGSAVAGMSAYQNSLTECEILGEITTNRYEAFKAWFNKMNVLVLLLQEPPDTLLVSAHFLAGANFVRVYDEAIAGCLDDAPPPDPEADWYLSPDRILEASTGAVTFTDNPIQDAIGADQWSSSGKNRPEMINRGDTVSLAPGDYHWFRITLSTDNSRTDGEKVSSDADLTWGQDPITWLIAPDRASILPNPVGGSQTLYLEWGGAYGFENLDFIGDDWMGIGSENPASERFSYHQGFRDFEFIECSVWGNYDAEKDGEKGDSNKWAIINYQMGRSARGVPGWKWVGGRIGGIWEEHAHYFHNVQGDIWIEDVEIKWCGRTAFQMANRFGEGPPGVGDLTFLDLRVEDVCLQDGGGGSAFSFNGNHTGTILLDNVTVRLGANPDIHPVRMGNFTGALVIHAGEDTLDNPNGDVIVQGCDFQVGPEKAMGSARRPNIMVGACESFTLMNSRVAMIGDQREALDISPDMVVGMITLDDDNEIIGKCLWDGDTFPDYETMLAAIGAEPKVRIQ
jgi:hypothetical protein